MLLWTYLYVSPGTRVCISHICTCRILNLRQVQTLQDNATLFSKVATSMSLFPGRTVQFVIYYIFINTREGQISKGHHSDVCTSHCVYIPLWFEPHSAGHRCSLMPFSYMYGTFTFFLLWNVGQVFCSFFSLLCFALTWTSHNIIL